MANFKCPKIVHFVSVLPRTPAGKVRKSELRELVVAVARSTSRRRIASKL